MKKNTFKVSLSSLAKIFGYELEVDPFEDVHHSGYSKKSILGMNLNLEKKFENVDKLFPFTVASVLEGLERDAFAVAIKKERISALVSALEKIDLIGGGAEYIDLNGRMISEKAGVQSVDVDEESDLLSITIINPVHLINAIINGVGLYVPDLSEDDSHDSIQSKLHHLKDYFSVYGESKPDGELSSQYSPNINDDDFNSSLEAQISCLTREEVSEAIKDSIESDLLTVEEAFNLATKITEYTELELKQSIIDSLNSNLEDWRKKLFWNKS